MCVSFHVYKAEYFPSFCYLSCAEKLRNSYKVKDYIYKSERNKQQSATSETDSQVSKPGGIRRDRKEYGRKI